ncbi:hypothetical protein PENSTE_c004G02820 [Penicillium steckii]|uniref:Protein kinase domain-containing protein n=1 Tax=Penicillium steckii TaxID=303698 RepID=A0A1V6TMN6_9EURO|nr:hypothetical protein PENSTE_c004G02820 [Penicillium steckii]
MKKEEDLQSNWPDVGKNHMVFIESSLDNAPPIPYRIGYRFKAQVHTPEKKLPKIWRCCQPNEPSKLGLSVFDSEEALLRRCLKCPPLPGVIGKDSIELEIQGWVRIGQENGAQLFTVCPSKRSSQQDTYSVKDMPQSGLIAKSSSNEATTKREVRMILIELVKGITMAEFSEPRDLPQQVRKNILCALIDLESQIFQKGIHIGTLRPRNVILKEPIDVITKPDVVIVDFERAFSRRDVKKPVTGASLENWAIPGPGRLAWPYTSPILLWDEPPDHFENWIDWEWKPWLHEEFRHTAHGITPKLRKYWGVPA